MKVRRAEAKDIQEILKLNKKLFDFEQAFGKQYNMDWTYSQVGKTYFDKRISDKNGICLVAEEEKKIIGYLMSYVGKYPYRTDIWMAEIENMFVEESYRRKGVGRALVKALLKTLKERKVRRMKVEARCPNEQALQFYKAVGFSDFNLILEREV
jgi:ribosomal protein S18 acetylase RimI-like enzyme